MMKSRMWSLAMSVAGAMGMPLSLDGNDFENVYRVLSQRMNRRAAMSLATVRSGYGEAEKDRGVSSSRISDPEAIRRGG